MPTDINVWNKLVKDATRGLSDEALQRRAWFGIGPEVSSPTEDICQLVDDTDSTIIFKEAILALMTCKKTAGIHLLEVILQHEERHKLDPEKQIDDPRWIKIRQAAQQFLDSLN